MTNPETTRAVSSLTWISESVALPLIGQDILLATPRQTGEFWDIRTAWLSAQHEGVTACPVPVGARWPTNYSWRIGRGLSDICLVTGNSWWALLSQIPLPPGARHGSHNGFHLVEQIGNQFVPMREEISNVQP